MVLHDGRSGEGRLSGRTLVTGNAIAELGRRVSAFSRRLFPIHQSRDQRLHQANAPAQQHQGDEPQDGEGEQISEAGYPAFDGVGSDAEAAGQQKEKQKKAEEAVDPSSTAGSELLLVQLIICVRVPTLIHLIPLTV